MVQTSQVARFPAVKRFATIPGLSVASTALVVELVRSSM